MAYTKAPSVSTQQTVRVPVESSQLPGATTALGTNYINCHPIHYKQWGTDPIHVVEKRPYLSLQTTLAATILPSTSIVPRGMYNSVHSGVVVCQGNNVYTQSGLSHAVTYSTGYVGFTEYSINTTTYTVILESHPTAAHMWYLNHATNAWTDVALGVGAYGDPVFLDGYIFFNSYPTNPGADNQRIYNSTIGAPTTFSTGTDYIDAEINSDRIVTIGKHHNHLVAFNERTIEFFYDNANQYGSPLTRNASYVINVGMYTKINLAASPLVAYVNDTIIFVGRTSSGAVGLYLIENFQLKDISSKYLTRLLSQTAGLDYKATLQTVQVRGLQAALLTFTDPFVSAVRQFAYIVDENIWVEWKFLETTAATEFTPMLTTSYGSATAPYSGLYTIMIAKRITSGTTYYELYFLDNQSQTASHDQEEITARIITGLLDFGINNQKHYRYVDVLGDFGSNTIQLEFTKTTDYASYTDMGTLDYTTKNRADPIRYRNLGRAIEMAFRITITGRQNMLYQGLDVTYNQGTF